MNCFCRYWAILTAPEKHWPPLCHLQNLCGRQRVTSQGEVSSSSPDPAIETISHANTKVFQEFSSFVCLHKTCLWYFSWYKTTTSKGQFFTIGLSYILWHDWCDTLTPKKNIGLLTKWSDFYFSTVTELLCAEDCQISDSLKYGSTSAGYTGGRNWVGGK